MAVMIEIAQFKVLFASVFKRGVCVCVCVGVCVCVCAYMCVCVFV